MEKFIVEGGHKLQGELEISSAKNAILPILAGSILTEGKCTIHNCPEIKDVINMLKILHTLGCDCTFLNGNIEIDSTNCSCHEIPSSLSSALRSSIFLMGSVLARFKKAIVAYPGGCDIGLRPINLHINGLKALNVKIKEEGGYIFCDGSDMRGGVVYLDMPSVGATENVMLAATLTKGTTVIKNAAREPEIVDLQRFLNRMGAKIKGAGRSTIVIEGVEKLKPTCYQPMFDRIVAGTYLIAGAMTGGEILLSNCFEEPLWPLLNKLSETTCKLYAKSDKMYLRSSGRLNCIKSIVTSPHPGFPTDLQAQITALQTISKGVSIVEENIFEMRFRHIVELNKMGADIAISGSAAIIKGVKKLQGAKVTASDLRGGASLCLAGLVAEGQTEVSEIFHIDRGYCHIEKDLQTLGAKITRQVTK